MELPGEGPEAAALTAVGDLLLQAREEPNPSLEQEEIQCLEAEKPLCDIPCVPAMLLLLFPAGSFALSFKKISFFA